MVTIEWNQVDAINRRNLDGMNKGAGLDFLAANQLVLIGQGHNPAYVALAEKNHGYKGVIVFDGKVLAVTGVPANQAQFEEAVKRVSKRPVKFY
jgi:hypothetical protein